MAVDLVEDTTAPAAPPVGPVAAAGAPVRIMAMALWGVVGSLLGYGVIMTVIKATALFG